jgi:hypothetical protein
VPESLQAVDLFFLRVLKPWQMPALDTLMSWIGRRASNGNCYAAAARQSGDVRL